MTLTKLNSYGGESKSCDERISFARDNVSDYLLEVDDEKQTVKILLYGNFIKSLPQTKVQYKIPIINMATIMTCEEEVLIVYYDSSKRVYFITKDNYTVMTLSEAISTYYAVTIQKSIDTTDDEESLCLSDDDTDNENHQDIFIRRQLAIEFHNDVNLERSDDDFNLERSDNEIYQMLSKEQEQYGDYGNFDDFDSYVDIESNFRQGYADEA